MTQVSTSFEHTFLKAFQRLLIMVEELNMPLSLPQTVEYLL